MSVSAINYDEAQNVIHAKLYFEGDDLIGD